jgi:peroxiredoxin
MFPRKIHPSTTLAVLFILISLACYFPGYILFSLSLTVLAFFGAIREVSKYTGWYQFIVVILTCTWCGLQLDLENHSFLMTLSLLLMASVCLLRIMLFPFFSYTGYPWFEPVVMILSLLVYVTGVFFIGYDWKAFVFPLPIVIFSVVFAWGTMKDKNQLLNAARGGYKVKVGNTASDFELPDQDNAVTRLSDYRLKRNVLLIFVRGDWCPGCHMMLRTYEKNNEKFKSKDVFVMAIGPDPVGVNREMVEKLGVEYKVLSDEGQKTAMVYGVQLREYDNKFADSYKEGIPLPASFLIDKQGVVRYVSRPDKVGEFLNPSSIFPILEQIKT